MESSDEIKVSWRRWPILIYRLNMMSTSGLVKSFDLKLWQRFLTDKNKSRHLLSIIRAPYFKPYIFDRLKMPRQNLSHRIQPFYIVWYFLDEHIFQREWRFIISILVLFWYFQWMMFQSITTLTSRYYNVSEDEVTWLAQVSMVSMCVTLIPTTLLSEG